MTVKDLSCDTHFKILSMPCPEREIRGVYIGDLLSWVMTRAQRNNAWITIMSNINVIATASLADVSCVILAEDVTLTDDVLSAANQKGINVLSTSLSSFHTAVLISDNV